MTNRLKEPTGYDDDRSFHAENYGLFWDSLEVHIQHSETICMATLYEGFSNEKKIYSLANMIIF